MPSVVGKRNSLNPEIVDEEQVAEVIAMMSGVPVQRIAQGRLKLRQMKDDLTRKVIGQDEPVENCKSHTT